MENTLKLDWLSFTYKPSLEVLESTGKTEFESFRMMFPEFDAVLDECCLASRHGQFYEVVLSFNESICISYNSNQPERRMGVNVSVPSHGLEWLFNAFHIDMDKPDSLPLLLSFLISRDCKFSRIDLAYDDFTKKFRPSDYGEWFINQRIITNCRTMNYCTSRQEKGHTFYLGSRSSGRMLRIYDKDVQSKGEVDAVRYEFELHSSHANHVADFIIKNTTLPFGDYLLNMFRVIEFPKSEYSNPSMIAMDPEWKEWIESLVSRIVITIPHHSSHPSVDRLNAWVECISGSLHAALKIMGWQAFTDLISNANIPDRYVYLIEEVTSKVNDPPE